MKSIRNQLLIHLTELFNWKICRNTIYFALLCSHFTWFCRWFSQKSFRIMFCIQEKKTTTYLFDIKWHSAKSFSCATKNAHVTHSWSSWNIACKSEREQWKIHLDNCTNKNFDVTLYMCIWNRVFMCVTVIWCGVCEVFEWISRLAIATTTIFFSKSTWIKNFSFEWPKP